MAIFVIKSNAQPTNNNKMKILFVVTSYDAKCCIGGKIHNLR
jgi:hypothetical protein